MEEALAAVGTVASPHIFMTMVTVVNSQPEPEMAKETTVQKEKTQCQHVFLFPKVNSTNDDTEDSI